MLDGWTASVSRGREAGRTASELCRRERGIVLSANRGREAGWQLCGLIPFCFQWRQRQQRRQARFVHCCRDDAMAFRVFPTSYLRAHSPPISERLTKQQPHGLSPPCADHKHQIEIPTAPSCSRIRQKPRSRSRTDPRSFPPVARDTPSPPVPRCGIL